MENKKYESPKFEFREMRLLEAVADTCWGYKYGWYDTDKNGVYDKGEDQIQLSHWGSCNDVALGLVNYLKRNHGISVTRNDVKENTHSSIVRPIVKPVVS